MGDMAAFVRRLHNGYKKLHDFCYSEEQAVQLAEGFMRSHKPESVEYCYVQCSDGRIIDFKERQNGN